MNRRSYVFGIIGVITLIATIVIYMLVRNGDANISTILGFCFILFAEIVLFGGLIGIELLSKGSSQIIIRSGCGVALIAYSITVFISSLIYITMNTDKFVAFWIIQILLFVAVLIALITFFTISKSVKESDEKVLQSVISVNRMIESLELLKSNTKYENQIYKLIEDLKYSDVSSSVGVDAEIETQIAMLQISFLKEDETDDINAILKKIAILINSRKLMVKNQKVGGL